MSGYLGSANGGGEGEWQALAGSAALESVAGDGEDRWALTGVPTIRPERAKLEPEQIPFGLVDLLSGAGTEGLARPVGLSVAGRATAATEEAFARFGVQRTERWISSSTTGVRRPSHGLERPWLQPRLDGRYESLEDTLSLLAERMPGEPQEEILGPHDALFAVIGRSSRDALKKSELR